jgi:acetyl esterase/lipase
MRITAPLAGFMAVVLLGLLSLPCFAEPATITLWPDGPPDSNGLTGSERGGHCVGNISTATLTIHLPPKEKATGAAVVLIPGGGYGVVCVGTEGHPIAKHLNERGIAGIVLKYRLPNKRHEIPANDARRAIRTVRSKAAEWNIDPQRVGVWGFSAGGHLSSTVATVFDKGKPDAKDAVEQQSSRPDFAILFYPVITMEKGVTHGGSRNNLMGSTDLSKRYSSEARVTRDTPPTFLLHCSDDRAVPVENSLRFYRSLIKHNVPATCLIFEKGGHGPGAFGRNPSWAPAFDAWLKDRKCIK